MDLATMILLALEGCFALWLLWREELLDRRRALIVSILLTVAAFSLRAASMPFR